MSTKKQTIAYIFLGMIIFLLAGHTDVWAAPLTNAGILDSVLKKYETAAASWASVMQNRATWLFTTLAGISIVWNFSQLLFHRSSIAEFFGEFIRFIMFTGFFLWLLRNGPLIAEAIIKSMRKIGAEASGQETLQPSTIMDIGFKIMFDVIDRLSSWELTTAIGSLLIAAVILVVLTLVAVNMLLLLCAGWVLAYAGIFFLGFGGSRWTSDMAINYFKTVLGLGASLMTMTLLVGIGTEIISEAMKQMSKTVKLEELAILLVFSISLLLLVDKLPAMVSGIITGASIGSMGVGSFSAGAAVGAGAVAGAAVSAASAVTKAAVSGGAANVVGAMQALRAAGQSVASMSSGSGGASGMDGSGGESGSGKSLSSAMGIKPQASSLGNTLARGAGSMLKNSLASQKNAFMDRASQTVGGKLASTIQNSTQHATQDTTQTGQDDAQS